MTHELLTNKTKHCLYCGFEGETIANYCQVTIQDLDTGRTDKCGQPLKKGAKS